MSEAALAVVVASKPRTFKTVKGALIWFRKERARRLVLGRDAGGVRVCRTREQVEETNLAFGLISACLVPETGKDAILDEKAMRQLFEWFCSDRSRVNMADELGLSEHILSQRMGFLESALRRKFKDHGLIAVHLGLCGATLCGEDFSTSTSTNQGAEVTCSVCVTVVRRANAGKFPIEWYDATVEMRDLVVAVAQEVR